MSCQEQSCATCISGTFDSLLDLEYVHDDNAPGTKSVNWLHSLRNRLTFSLSKPLGDPLMVCIPVIASIYQLPLILQRMMLQ